MLMVDCCARNHQSGVANDQKVRNEHPFALVCKAYYYSVNNLNSRRISRYSVKCLHPYIELVLTGDYIAKRLSLYSHTRSVNLKVPVFAVVQLTFTDQKCRIARMWSA